MIFTSSFTAQAHAWNHLHLIFSGIVYTKLNKSVRLVCGQLLCSSFAVLSVDLIEKLNNNIIFTSPCYWNFKISLAMDLDARLEEIYTDDAQLTRVSTEIGKGILNNEITLIALVESLGPKLTHKETAERGRGMNILSVVLNTLSSQDFLSEKELAFIVEFLHDRLHDQHLIIPKVIHCIKSIISSNNLPEGAAGKLLLQLFKEANIQSHIHKDRHAFFLILASVLDRRIGEIKSWASDYFMYFIQSIDGEKDPRNLLLIFQLVPISLNNFPLGPFVEELFEVLSCYFPVDFTPITTDANEQAITRENLASALNSCLSHTNLFAPLLVPLALEKLESNLISSKLDSLKLLALCCERSYSPEDLEPYLPAIWKILRSEIFMGVNESVNTQALSLVTSAFSMISQSSKVLTSSITMIFNECRSHLMEPELRLMVSSSSVLIAIAEASDTACELLFSLLLPVLYDQFLKKTLLLERQNILTFIIRLVSITRRFPSVNLTSSVSNWDEIVAAMFNLISHSESVLVNLSLEFFNVILPKLEPSSFETLQHHLLNLLSTDTAFPSDDTKVRLFSCLENAARYFPNEISKVTTSCLLEWVDNLKDSNLESFELILSAISECSYVLPVARQVVPFLLEKLRHSLPQENVNEDITLVLSNLQRLLLFLKCFNQILIKGCNFRGIEFTSTGIDLLAFCDYMCVSVKTIDALVEVVETIRYSRVFHHQSQSEEEVLGLRQQVYLNANDSIRVLLRSCDGKTQSTIIDFFWNNRLEKNQGSIRQYLIVTPGLLVESLLGTHRRSIRIYNHEELLDEILHFVLNPIPSSIGAGGDEGFRNIDSQALIRLFANLVNKLESDSVLRNVEAKVENLLRRFVRDDVFLNALAMRGAPSVDRWMEICVQLMGVTSIGQTTAEKFNILMEDCLFTVNADSHCLYRFLYKQRVFLTSVPKLVKAYKEAPTDHPTRVNYIRTLSCLLLHVPRTVLYMELDSVLPLLIASLTCATTSAAVCLSSLKALDDLLVNSAFEKETTSPLLEYFHDLVPYLVKLAGHQSNMNIRILALQCLQKCSKFPVHMVIQEKSLVTDCLKATLDDPKRLDKQFVSKTEKEHLSGYLGGEVRRKEKEYSIFVLDKMSQMYEHHQPGSFSKSDDESVDIEFIKPPADILAKLGLAKLVGKHWQGLKKTDPPLRPLHMVRSIHLHNLDVENLNSHRGVFLIKRKYSCCLCFWGTRIFGTEVSVDYIANRDTGPVKLGTVKQRFKVGTPEYMIFNATGKETMDIQGPRKGCPILVHPHPNEDFPVFEVAYDDNIEEEKQVGKIYLELQEEQEVTESAEDVEGKIIRLSLGLKLNRKLTPKKKALVLAAAICIDFLTTSEKVAVDFWLEFGFYSLERL
ncbi:unnamed protein product [Allacma fusca]|uniref:MMS19 nucleotide excision repair protein n=1 Tax=Allacma fusca TaxID=39272 RepID=A0A8J2LMC5_9HEXA|nr:unnamed protein product [Allacma fusca]